MTNTSSLQPTQATDAATNPVDGRPAKTRLAVILLIATCLPVLGSVLLSPVLPLLSKQFATVPGVAVLVPLIVTVPSLVIGLLAPFAGSLVDRIGRRRLLIVALVVYAIFGTAPLYLSSLPAIILTRIAVGITEAAIITCSTTLITDYFSGQRRNKYLSLNTLLTSIAAAVFVAVGGVLGEQGWRTPFWLYGLSILLVIPVLIAVWEPRNPRVVTDGVRPKLTPIPAAYLVMPLIVGFLTGLLFFSIIVEMPYVFTDLGVKNSGQIGLFSAIASLAAAAGSIAFRWLAKRGPGRLVPWMFALAGVGLIVIWIAPVAPIALLGAVLTSLGTGLMIPMGLTWLVARLALDQRGRAIGRGTGVLFIGQFIAPLVVLGISGFAGSIAAALGVLGIVSFVGAVIFGVILSRQEHPDLTRPVV